MTEKTLIKIDSGEIRVPVQVDDNPQVVVHFNPNDSVFAKRLHAFYNEVKDKLVEINMKQAEWAEQAPSVDENGMPIEIDEVMAEYEAINVWLREKIDQLLGAGTAQSIYGDTIYTGERVDVYIQLFDGIFALSQPARISKANPYLRKK